MSIEDMNMTMPPSAKLVSAYGELSEISLQDEVADMSPERRATFAEELERMHCAERELALHDNEVFLD